MEKALKQLEEASQSRASEHEKTQDKVTRLRAEAEKVEKEHRDQVKRVTESASSEIAGAKSEFEEKEKQLRAEIESLKQENQSLKDADRAQKEQADSVAQKMESWRALA